MPPSGPELSVVVATHNRRELLLRCVESLSAQSADPASFEVIVADDGSTDGTVAAVEALDTSLRLHCLGLPPGGQATAQNAALERAAGAVVLFLDDDVIAAPGLIDAHIEAHRCGEKIVGVGYLEQEPRRGRDWYARLFARSWNRHYDELEGEEINWTDCFGANLSARRDALEEIGGLSTDIPVGEDIDLAFRLWRAGSAPRFLSAARAVHDDQKPWRKLLADSRRQGAGEVSLADRYPEATAQLFGWFRATSRREVSLRRLMLALRVPPSALALLGNLIPGAGRKQVWFDFVSRYAYWKAVRGAVDRDRWQRLTRGVPVLMYHAFGEGSDSDRYVVSRRMFACQLLAMRLLRYRGMHFDQFVATLRDSGLPPRRTVVITIDDGYLDNLEVALPLLRRFRFPATVFLVSQKMGGVNDWTFEGALANRPLLSWGQVDELRAGGVSIGAHTRTHPELPTLSDGSVPDEIGGSREDLEERLGVPVTTFAFPFGLFDERAVEAAGEAGFEAACTVEPRLAGLGEDPLRVPRIEVRNGQSLTRFVRNLWLGSV